MARDQLRVRAGVAQASTVTTTQSTTMAGSYAASSGVPTRERRLGDSKPSQAPADWAPGLAHQLPLTLANPVTAMWPIAVI